MTNQEIKFTQVQICVKKSQIDTETGEEISSVFELITVKDPDTSESVIELYENTIEPYKD